MGAQKETYQLFGMQLYRIRAKLLEMVLRSIMQLFNRNGFRRRETMMDTLKWLMSVALLNINLQDKDGWSAVLLASRHEWSTCFLLACSNSPAGK